MATNAPTPQGYAAAMIYPALTLAPNQTFERKITLYAGPKEYSTLARIASQLNNNLDLVMSFGWAGFVSKALLLGMNTLHSMCKFSYGWAIIAITVIIKAVFWPLTQASTRSMKRLQALQPQMNAIKEKYKDDPVKMNKKTMEFMKENKVSPLGGCLPMIITMPLFIGFFSMLQSSAELRFQHFLWAPDLSAPDTVALIFGIPLNIMPLLMGATMLYQMRLTPQPTVDNAQAKMMKFMPVIFIFFCYSYSCALSIYMTINGLFTIGQQLVINRMKDNEPAPVAGTAGMKNVTPAKKKGRKG